jgi:hypothetical protein
MMKSRMTMTLNTERSYDAMATRLAPETYLQFWQEGQSLEFGLEVKVHPDDQTKFVNALYEARDTFGGFEDMMIFQPQPPGTIFIMKNTTELPG